MPPEETAAPAIETPAAAPEVAAEVTKAPERESRGKESFADRLERLGWNKETPHGENPNALGSKARAAAGDPEPDEEPTKPEVPKPKAPKPETPAALDDEKKQLEALVKKLGYQLEGQSVTVAERAALREERRTAKLEIARLEQEARARTDAMLKTIEERDAGAKPRLGKLDEFEKAVADDDHEAIAKLMGFENYDKWQEHIIGVKSDPNYKTLRSLKERVEREAKEREEREAKAAREAEEQATQAEQQRAAAMKAQNQANYRTQMAKEMAASEDPLLKAMADDPAFVGAMFRVMEENWDGERTLTLAQALETPARGASQPLKAELKKLHDKLAPIFATPVSSPGAVVAAVKAGVGKPAPRTPVSPKTPAVSQKKLDDREWKANAAKRLEEAAREEAQQKGRRTG